MKKPKSAPKPARKPELGGYGVLGEFIRTVESTKPTPSTATTPSAPTTPPTSTDPWTKGYEIQLVHKPITIATRSYPDGRRVCRVRWREYVGFDVAQEPEPVHPAAAIGRMLKLALTPEGLAHLRAALDEPTDEHPTEEAAREDGAA